MGGLLLFYINKVETIRRVVAVVMNLYETAKSCELEAVTL